MSNHELKTASNVRYPGGKDGWSYAWCTCNPDRLWWGHNDAAALKSAKEHKKAKDEAETVIEEDNFDYRPAVVQWLDGEWNHKRHPELAALLTEGNTVTLTYRQLIQIINAVRYNSQQR